MCVYMRTCACARGRVYVVACRYCPVAFDGDATELVEDIPKVSVLDYLTGAPESELADTFSSTLPPDNVTFSDLDGTIDLECTCTNTRTHTHVRLHAHMHACVYRHTPDRDRSPGCAAAAARATAARRELAV